MAELDDILKSGDIKSIIIGALNQAYAKGQMTFDDSSFTMLLDTGFNGVRVQVGQEVMYLVYNDSGADIANGKACRATGADITGSVLTIGLASNVSFPLSAATLGLATHLIADESFGLVTEFGITRDWDTQLLSVAGLAYLGVDGDLTNTKPLYPAQRILLGSLIKSHASEGKFQVKINRVPRAPINGTYSFTSSGVGAGTFWVGGFYDWETTSDTLSLVGDITLGIVNIAKAAHIGIVAGGIGTVTGGGQVGLSVTGIQDSETGNQTAAQTAIITDDITSLSLNDYLESVEKFSGEVTLQLYIVSGTPSDASLTFNYGFSKYDDFEDRDYTITGLEVKWKGNASSTLDVALMKHDDVGWIYAASGFVAGNGDICRKSVDQQLSGNVANGADGAYKRVQLNEYIEGAGSGHEGHIMQIITGANGTIQTMGLRVNAVSEVLDF